MDSQVTHTHTLAYVFARNCVEQRALVDNETIKLSPVAASLCPALVIFSLSSSSLPPPLSLFLVMLSFVVLFSELRVRYAD